MIEDDRFMLDVMKFRVYVDYINNTTLEPLPIAIFDDDWDPVGPKIRDYMVDAGIIQVRADGIYLRPDLKRN